jgi:uncharacterized Zn-binding protein involved in type VI secretion
MQQLISKRGRSLALALVVCVALVSGPAQAGSPAARVGDLTTHGGVIQSGSPDVRIAGQPAWRVGDFATCPIVIPPGIPHVGGPIATAGSSTTVFINGQPAARVGSLITEPYGPSQVSIGAPTVLIGD